MYIYIYILATYIYIYTLLIKKTLNKRGNRWNSAVHQKTASGEAEVPIT
jgi:hypothetical protein